MQLGATEPIKQEDRLMTDQVKQDQIAIQQMDTNAIKPYDGNPRKISQKAIQTVADSITQYGFQQPIVVDKDHVIIVGHTRYQAARDLKMAQVPVIVAQNLTEEQVNAYRIMDNKSNENTRWDEKELTEQLQQLIKEENLQELSYETGFSESELQKYFKTTTDEELEEKYRQDTHYKTQVGDIWSMGEHRLMCGDSNKEENIKKLLDGDEIDLIWEDPPYGIEYFSPNAVNYTAQELKYREEGKDIKNDNLKRQEFEQFLTDHLQAVHTYWKPGAAIYWCHDIRFTQLLRDVLSAKDTHIADTLIWKKNNASNWISDYMKYYEPIIYAWKKGAQHNWYGKSAKNTIDLDELEHKSKEQLIKIIKAIPSNYQEIDREAQKLYKMHPTLKPVKLIVYHIINSTKQGDIVFDGFSGAGSSIMACQKTMRKSRAMELEPKYVDTAIRRWQDETGLEAYRHDGVKFNDVQETEIADQMLAQLDIEEVLNGE